MKSQPSPIFNRHISRRVGDFASHLGTLCFTFLSLILLPTGMSAAINHPPIVGWLPDQRVMQGSGAQFVKKYFRIIDPDGTTTFTFPTKQSTNSMWYSAQNVTVSACTPLDVGCEGVGDMTGYKVTFSNTPGTPDYAAIRLGVQDAGGLIGYTSFTLRVDPAGTSNPPSLGALPNRVLQLQTNGVATYITHFVIGDLDSSGEEDVSSINAGDFILHSSNHMLLDDVAIVVALNPNDDYYAPLEAPRSYTLTATTKAGAAPGVTTVTVELPDPDLIPKHSTSTSFVLRTIANSDAEPLFGTSSDGTFLVCPVPTPNPTPPQYHFTVVSNDSTAVEDLRVTAKSSNTNLVPNDATHLVCSTPAPITGVGTVTITPVLPLPTPSPGVPQSSTITLTVSDGSYQRQSTFLYVVSDPTSPAIAFARPAGVYLLDASQGDHRGNAFLTGETLAVSWAQVESVEGTYVWDTLNEAIGLIDPSQEISLNIQEEPCYIAEDINHLLEFGTWCDDGTSQPLHLVDCSTTNPCGTGGTVRAVPWDSRLQDRRDAFYQRLATDLNSQGVMSRVTTINPNLPGGNNGIRNVSVDFDNMPGYTRQRLLESLQDELRTLQDNFPGKLIQIGFFTAADNNSNPPLWNWLFHDASDDTDPTTGVHFVALGDEFNGIMRPRVSFFLDNLAATRTLTSTGLESSSAPNYITPASTTAYTFSPISSVVPAFAYYSAPTNDQYRNGATFQSNTPWSEPFTTTDGIKLIRTINGSPNDGMEAAFNSYLSQYLEIYPGDVDEAQPQSGDPATLNAALWQGELQSWKNYTDSRRNLAPIEGPAGLNIERTSSNSNLVTWFPVYGATTYTMQKAPLTGSSPTWVDANCNDITETQCLDTSQQTTSEYAYRVQANNGTTSSLWSYVGIFLSESVLDGYVERKNSAFTAFNNITPQPGIVAGEGSGMPLPHRKGFVSFNTGVLGSTATLLSAKLRLNQATAGTNFGTPSQCMVDIKKGSFNGISTLEGADYNVQDQTTTNAFPVTDAGLNGWFEAELTPSSTFDNISNSDHTQFRIYFAEAMTANRFEGWYSGESSGNNARPQLIVRYNQ